jgi:hypothetical protein
MADVHAYGYLRAMAVRTKVAFADQEAEDMPLLELGKLIPPALSTDCCSEMDKLLDSPHSHPLFCEHCNPTRSNTVTCLSGRI